VLFVAPAVTAIAEALASAHVTGGKLAVARDARLARALAAPGREVIAVGVSPRAAKKLAGALPDAGSLAPGSLDAAIVVDIAAEADDAWEATLRAWCARVRDGGAVVLVDRRGAAIATRRALCAGLSELEQRHAGRSVVTSGLVTHLA
jgi:nicotinamidase-related amidase